MLRDGGGRGVREELKLDYKRKRGTGSGVIEGEGGVGIFSDD